MTHDIKGDWFSNKQWHAWNAISCFWILNQTSVWWPCSVHSWSQFSVWSIFTCLVSMENKWSQKLEYITRVSDEQGFCNCSVYIATVKPWISNHSFERTITLLLLPSSTKTVNKVKHDNWLSHFLAQHLVEIVLQSGTAMDLLGMFLPQNQVCFLFKIGGEILEI